MAGRRFFFIAALALAGGLSSGQNQHSAAAEEPPRELILRVGLATDQARLSLPCCDTRWQMVVAGQPITLGATGVAEPAGNTTGLATWRLQVAALKDEKQARGIAAAVDGRAGLDAEVIFDAGSDLYRVRAGLFARREDAEAARPRLAPLGLQNAWAVTEGGHLENPAILVTIDGKTLRHPGRWLEISAPPEVGLPWQGTRYRGRLLIFLNDRGRLNVINELPLEDYLRGVVPREMGPAIFDRIEALKAQTVAARTYTVRNLAEFVEEGYDICSTPRCQVYGGMDVEHPLSDRAIEETAGLIAAWQGKPIDALYSATSGGHTEDVGVIFPLKKGEAYLRGVPCLEAGNVRLEGDGARGRPYPAGLLDLLLRRPGPDLAVRLQGLAREAGLTPPDDRLRSLDRAEVGRYVRSLFDLGLDARLVHADAATLTAPPADWPARERRLAQQLALLQPVEGSAALDSRAAETLLHELAWYLGLLREPTVSFLQLDQGALSYRQGADTRKVVLPAGLATFQRRGDGWEEGALDLMAGDPIVLHWHGEQLLAVRQLREPRAVNLDRQASRRAWTFFRTDQDVQRAVQARYPGFPFEGFQVLARGVSGRVGKLRLLGRGNTEQIVEGLAVRWTLDLWDNLFTSERAVQNGQQGWLFRGRGWGHGVGMSQAGAYGMAVRGATFRDILEHYYTGITIGRLVVKTRPRVGESG